VTLQFGLVVLLWLIGLSALAVLALIWQRGQLRAHTPLSLLMVASSLYAFGYALELTGDSVAWVLATYRIQHLGIAFAPTLLVMVAANFSFRRWLASPWVTAAMIGLSLATVVIVYTDPWHDLYHANPRMDTSGPFPLIEFDRGAWYVVYHVYAALAVVIANGIFLRQWLDRRAAATDRARAGTLFVASVIPWLGSLVYLSGVLPLPLDVSPIALAATSGLLAWGILRHGLVDVSPIARHLVFERLDDPAVVLDAGGRVVDHNAAAATLFGPHSDELTGQRLRDLLATVAARPMGQQSVTGTVVDEQQVELAGRVFDTRVAPLHDRRGRALGRVVVLRDVSEHAHLARLLKHLATTDGLTGVANRRHFMDLSERVLARARFDGRAVSFILFDLDGFKLVNDRHGHVAGDLVLTRVATAVTSSVRVGDVAGRYGGEEFAVCLPGAGAGAALAVAERLRATLAALRVDHDGAVIRITGSFGVVSVVPDDTTSLDDLLARADALQYEAKAKGGGRVAGEVATP
jgi:diguanylate cyclase (GGDEF)-like protein/PAS domain S-box-containing protein